MRADVPSITSTARPSCPSGLGPDADWPCSHQRIAALTASTSTGVSAVGVCGGRRRAATLSIGLRGSTSWRTASENASRSTTRACRALL